MPTIITHTVVAGIAGKIFARTQMSVRFWLLSIVCSVLPDADVIGFSIGIPYAHFWGHRGFLHSIFFAMILSLLIVFAFFRSHKVFSKSWWKYIIYFFVLGASHGVLDAFTNGGLGIALLSPFDNTRYFFPWTPLEVSPIGVRAFVSNWGLRAIISEIWYIWLPLAIVVIAINIARSKFGNR